MHAVRTVTGTAFVVAEYRAEENLAVQPLYQDPVVPLFLGEGSREAAARAAKGFPEVKELVKIRTRYFDDMLDRQIGGGARQVVVLGAGLDTRAIRKASPGVAFFEIDDAATMELKRRVLATHGIRADVHMIGADYVADGMLRLLVDRGFDLDLPTYVIWEGNTMYLDAAADRAILGQLRDAVSHVRVSFDYFVPAVIARTTGALGMTMMADNFERMGAPWVTGIGDIRAFASELSLRVVEDVTTGALARRYRPTAPPPVFGPYYSIATLGTY